MNAARTSIAPSHDINPFQSLVSNNISFIAVRFITFYWALVAGSLWPALHQR